MNVFFVQIILIFILGIVLNVLNVKLVTKEDVYLVMIICIFTTLLAIVLIQFCWIWQDNVFVQKDTFLILVIWHVFNVLKHANNVFLIKKSFLVFHAIHNLIVKIFPLICVNVNKGIYKHSHLLNIVALLDALLVTNQAVHHVINIQIE